jgi:anti-sigma regulatory factor (Ser/Thr protein kinase)
MDETQWISLAGDVRGETALVHIPRRPSNADEVMILADGVTQVDAWTGTALRTVIEYHGRVRQRRVVFSPPGNATVARLLAGLLDNDLPGNFCVSNDAAAVGSPPRSVILPATVIKTFQAADEVGDVIPELGSHYARQIVRFLAGAAVVLAENAVQHAGDSPIGAVATLAHERDEDELQLVVADLGGSITRSPDVHLVLQEAVQDSLANDGSFIGLTRQAERFGLDVTLTLAAGSGRLYWRAGTWTPAEAQHVEGFTAAVTVHL